MLQATHQQATHQQATQPQATQPQTTQPQTTQQQTTQPQTTQQNKQKALNAAQATCDKYAVRYAEVCEQTKKAVAAYTANPTERNKKLSTAAVKLAETAKKELEKLTLTVEVKRAELEQQQPAEDQKNTQKPLTFDDSVKNSTVAKATAMWAVVKEYRDAPAVKKLSDKQKLTYFREKHSFGMLMDELPIVTRYMICMGQYSAKALARVIDKSARMVHPPVDKRPKDYTQEQWICRQADYVQYMWEEYNKKKHYNMAERKYVWDSTYKLLKGEFDDFKNLHTDLTEKVEEEKKELSGAMARDLLQRIHEKTQPLADADSQALAVDLVNLLYKKAFDNVMTELTTEYPPLLESFTSYGTNENTNEKQTMRMIETVDTDRMAEIPDQYKPEELRGMEPVYNEVDEYEII